jgi:hypothetical protein
VQRQQRKSDAMTSFGVTACSAVYYQVPHCRFLIGQSNSFGEIRTNASRLLARRQTFTVIMTLPPPTSISCRERHVFIK